MVRFLCLHQVWLLKYRRLEMDGREWRVYGKWVRRIFYLGKYVDESDYRKIIIYSIRSMCTSLQHIVASNDNGMLQQNIEELFKRKYYPRFELQQFYSHNLYEQNEHFHFFIDILEEWNRKIEKQQIPNHSDTLFRKNIYIYNNLRSSILQPM